MCNKIFVLKLNRYIKNNIQVRVNTHNRKNDRAGCIIKIVNFFKVLHMPFLKNFNNKNNLYKKKRHK